MRRIMLSRCLFQLKICAEEGRPVGKAISDGEVLGQCTRCLGYVYLHERAFADAEVAFRQALSTLEAGDVYAIADAKLSIARLYQERGNRDEAREALNALLTEYRTIECQKGIAEVLVELSKLRQGSSDPDNQTHDFIQEAIQIYERLNNDVELRACHSLIETA